MHQKGHFKHRLFILTLWVLSGFTNLLFAESYYFFVQFTDKNNSPYTLDYPSAYLSTKAIERRNFQQIAIDSTDLPVNSSYISVVASQGVTVHSASKWINGVTVITADSFMMSTIRALPFVSKVQYTGKMLSLYAAPRLKSKNNTKDLNYGVAAAQINQLKGNVLHDLGFTGKGIQIGVLDAGFFNVDTNPAFDSLRIQHRLKGAISIIDPTIDVFREDTHGAHALSVMAGNSPNNFLGVAPHASYWLIQTEYVPSEYLFETDFWVRGIEFADSVGVDLINSSLGYSEFDDASMDFSYADMNGKVSRASIAAEMAAQKGILVCSSAGNEGAKPWKYISSPADADDILTVGAVTATGAASYFSSFGPSSDNRVKPEVCAQGTGTALVSTDGAMMNGNGTSFSSPVIAGLAACYTQYARSKSLYDVKGVREIIIKSASLYSSPEVQLGYGIPDFQIAIYSTQSSGITNNAKGKLYDTYYNVHTRQLVILCNRQLRGGNGLLEIFSASGVLIHKELLTKYTTTFDASYLTPGIYIAKLSIQATSQLTKIIIP